MFGGKGVGSSEGWSGMQSESWSERQDEGEDEGEI